MKALTITAGILFVVLSYAEFNHNHTPARALPECEGEKKAGCHKSIYERWELK